MNKEQAYDTLIQPLMAQIIEHAKAHGIAMVASFAIPTPNNEDLMCSTKLPDGDDNPHPLAEDFDRWRRGPQAFALTITSAATPSDAPSGAIQEEKAKP